jgi:hypothetical protein
VPDRVQVPELLVAAVPAVERGPENEQVVQAETFARRGCDVERSIRRRIVDDDDLREELSQVARNAREHVLDEPLRLVGNDEDPDLRALQHFPGRFDCALVDADMCARAQDSPTPVEGPATIALLHWS